MIKIIGAASENHWKMMQKIADVTEIDSIAYEDLGEGENYILTKNGKSVVLQIRGNKIDGGYMTTK